MKKEQIKQIYDHFENSNISVKEVISFLSKITNKSEEELFEQTCKKYNHIINCENKQVMKRHIVQEVLKYMSNDDMGYKKEQIEQLYKNIKEVADA